MMVNRDTEVSKYSVRLSQKRKTNWNTTPDFVMIYQESKQIKGCKKSTKVKIAIWTREILKWHRMPEWLYRHTADSKVHFTGQK